MDTLSEKKVAAASILMAALALGAAGTAQAHGHDGHDGHDGDRAVFVMTNDADANEVLAFQRDRYGNLDEPRHFKTGGRGSGGINDPLASQGSLTLSGDGEWLFAVNAGSGTLSVFHVRGARLDLTDVEPTQGSEPNAVAQHKNLVYVLNSAGTNSVVGFRFFAGRLFRIPDSRAFLTGAGVGSASLAFSPDGKFLLATERTTNVIDVFSVLAGGKVAALTTTPSVGAGAFSALFAPNGTAIVSQTAGSATGSSISSYAVQPDRTLVPISANVPTLGVANCWNAITPDGRFVYVSNTGSSSIAGFAVGADGGLTALPGTVVGQNPAGSGNLDIAISSDGDFLYSLNSAGGTLGVFAIDGATGALENLGTVGGLPASVGMNGIAAR